MTNCVSCSSTNMPSTLPPCNGCPRLRPKVAWKLLLLPHSSASLLHLSVSRLPNGMSIRASESILLTALSLKRMLLQPRNSEPRPLVKWIRCGGKGEVR